MKYHFRIHKEDRGYWAECIELSGCKTEGDNLEELEANMQESLNLYLDEPETSKIIFPLPQKISESKNVKAISVDPNVAFAFVLRRERLLRKLTQKKVADLLGVGLYSYQRLESSKTANPRFSTIVKLVQVFPRLKSDWIKALAA